MGIYLDTSALAKLYRPEAGSAAVERLTQSSANDCFIARLGVLEMHSVLALKVRAGELSSAESSAILQRFRSDIQERRFRVVVLRSYHFETAENLIGMYGPSHGLRTLDALHLAVAIDLKNAGIVSSIVAADKALCRVAVLEGLPSNDPELMDT